MTHGLLLGELVVEAGLPAPYAQGLFAQAGTYPVVMRLSTTPGDDVSTPRGMAIEVVGGAGARARQRARRHPGLRARQRPVFSAPAAQQFLGLREAEWELRVQPCTDITRMPIEDAAL